MAKFGRIISKFLENQPFEDGLAVFPFLQQLGIKSKNENAKAFFQDVVDFNFAYLAQGGVWVTELAKKYFDNMSLSGQRELAGSNNKLQKIWQDIYEKGAQEFDSACYSDLETLIECSRICGFMEMKSKKWNIDAIGRAIENGFTFPIVGSRLIEDISQLGDASHSIGIDHNRNTPCYDERFGISLFNHGVNAKGYPTELLNIFKTSELFTKDGTIIVGGWRLVLEKPIHQSDFIDASRTLMGFIEYYLRAQNEYRN